MTTRVSLVAVTALAAWAGAAPPAANTARQPAAPRPFQAYVFHKVNGQAEVSVLAFSNNTLLATEAGKPVEISGDTIKNFRWLEPDPFSAAAELMESNRFDAVLARLAPFTTRAFVTFSAPAPMYADRLIETVAEAMIGLGRYTQATAYLDGATNTLALDIMRARLYNKLAEPAKALSLLEPLRASKALSLTQLGIVNYEYGRAMMNTSTNYDEALDAFLRVKVFYRPDQATIARSEMGAVACYRAGRRP